MSKLKAESQGAVMSVQPFSGGGNCLSGFKIVGKREQFYRLKDGENMVRVVGDGVTGWMVWTVDSEKRAVPVRKRTQFLSTELVSMNVKKDENGVQEIPKQFVAFPFWIYEEKRIAVIEITQKSLLDGIIKKRDSKLYGSIELYDIIITKSGSGKTGTKYELSARDPKGLSDEILDFIDSCKDVDFDMNRLFDNEYPFKDYVVR